MGKNIFLILLLVIVSYVTTNGQGWGNGSVSSDVWNGSVSTDWNTPDNWSTGEVPNRFSRVGIPGSQASGNWPSLSSDVSVMSIGFLPGSQIDLNGYTITLNDEFGAIGATFNNSKATGGIILGITGWVDGLVGYYVHFDNNIVNGNFNITTYGLYSSTQFFEDGNQYNGNTVFNIYGALSVFISNSVPSQFNGDLTINRTSLYPVFAGAATTMFNSGATIKGNFSYTNNELNAADTYFGNPNSSTTIGGMVNIISGSHYFPISPVIFSMIRVNNLMPGGIIDVQNSIGFIMQNDTLSVASMSITRYSGNQYGYLLNNNITGNVTIGDDASYGGGWGTFIRNNSITGNSSFSNNGTNNFYDADSPGTGNRYLGNLAFTQTGSNMIVASGDYDEIGDSLFLSSTSDTALTLGKIKFTGDSSGAIEQLSGKPVYMKELVMSKTGNGTITLNTPLNISGAATFASGNIISSTLNSLIFLDSATQAGASAASFAEGPVTKIGNEGFTFPTGANHLFAPISITAPAAATDAFTAQYFNMSPGEAGYDSSRHDLTIPHISQTEYWMLGKTSGSAALKVTLSWDANRSSAVNSPAFLRVAHWNGHTWKDEGNGGTTGNSIAGTIQSLNTISDFSPFTLASTLNANLLIWPNPVTNILYIYTQTSKGSIEITDVNGRVVMEETLNNTVMSIPVGQLPAGIYFLRIMNDGQLHLTKFTKL